MVEHWRQPGAYHLKEESNDINGLYEKRGARGSRAAGKRGNNLLGPWHWRAGRQARRSHSFGSRTHHRNDRADGHDHFNCALSSPTRSRLFWTRLWRQFPERRVEAPAQYHANSLFHSGAV